VIVKSKRFPMEPMAAEDAALQLDLLNHDFYVFRSDETDSVSVIYRRRDGNYGLIAPDA
jgi:putative sigma-54 modulation protein